MTKIGKVCYHALMSTVNISLPEEQVNFVDRLVSLHGFANRSEFIRSVLRLLSSKPELVTAASTFPFIFPEGKSIGKVVADFKATGKYSAGFIKDLEEGLKKSKYFCR